MGYDHTYTCEASTFQNLPCNYHEESDQDKALLQYSQFQDIFYRGKEPPSTTTTTRTMMENRDVRSHEIDHHRGLMIKGIMLKLYERVSRIIRKLGLKIVERVNKIIYVPRTTRARGLNRGIGITIERFKVRTINIVVEGEVKKPQK